MIIFSFKDNLFLSLERKFCWRISVCNMVHFVFYAWYFFLKGFALIRVYACKLNEHVLPNFIDLRYARGKPYSHNGGRLWSERH